MPSYRPASTGTNPFGVEINFSEMENIGVGLIGRISGSGDPQWITSLPAIDGSNLLNVNANSKIAVNQTSHGFSVGNLIRLDGSNYVKALATSNEKQETVGMVAGITDDDNFSFALPGQYVTGLTGLTAGETYFLDDSISGNVVIREPSLSKPVFVASSTTAGVFVNYRGIQTS